MELYGYEIQMAPSLMHYGLLGMHWGTRRWQNEDGAFNDAGKQRYFSRGTGENYHPVKKGSASGMSKKVAKSASEEKNNSFDKEKAKKIAKGVAIGAAVVGGTILIAYGAKYMSDTDVLGKIRAGRLENAKLNEAFKSDMLKVKLDGKIERERIKTDFEKQMKMDKIDSDGNSPMKGVAEGAKKLYSAATSDKAKEAYKNAAKATGNAAKAVGSTAKKAYDVATSDQAKAVYKKSAQVAGNTAKKAYEYATSDQAKKYYKKTANDVAKTTNTAVKLTLSMAKSSVDAAKMAMNNPEKSKAAIDYTTQLIKNLGELSAVNSRNSATVSRSNTTDTYTRNQAIREYKRQHPNTKLTDSQIASNYGF